MDLINLYTIYHLHEKVGRNASNNYTSFPVKAVWLGHGMPTISMEKLVAKKPLRKQTKECGSSVSLTNVGGGGIFWSFLLEWREE